MAQQPRIKAPITADIAHAAAPPAFLHWTSGLLAPLVAFVSAGLTKLVGWDIPPTASWLLAGYGCVALGLRNIRYESFKWDAEPGSCLAQLKQTIATIRTILTIVIFASIIMLLATSRALTNQLPSKIAEVVQPLLASPNSKDAIVLKLAEPLHGSDGVSIYFASLDGTGAKVAPVPPAQIVTAQGAVAPGSGQQVYVIAAPSLLKKLVDSRIVPNFFQMAWLVLIFAIIFTAVVFMMEVLGGVQLEIANKKDRRD